MKKSEIKEITDMVMCATCEIIGKPSKSIFVFTYTNKGGFSSRIEIAGVFSEGEARKRLTEHLLRSARSWQPRSIPRKELDRASLKGQNELLWWKDNMGMTDVVLRIADMLREFDKKFGRLSWMDKQNNKEYDKALDRIRKEKKKYNLENSTSLVLHTKEALFHSRGLKPEQGRGTCPCLLIV